MRKGEITMKKAMTISYAIGNKLYMNITNKCPCSCTFCIRKNGDGAYGSDSLWLEHEPSFEEIKQAFDSVWAYPITSVSANAPAVTNCFLPRFSIACKRSRKDAANSNCKLSEAASIFCRTSSATFL